MADAILGMELNEQFGADLQAQIALLRQAGFSAFFVYWKRGMDLKALRRQADAQGMIFQSVHAPQFRVTELWYPTENTPDVLEELLECLRESAAIGVPIVVVHALCGFGMHTPTTQGLKNYEVLVREAERLGIKIAFENAEGEEYLAALLDHFAASPNVGFCWDSGHECCYNRMDLLARHGDRLIATHLNDNMGHTGPDEQQLHWQDDLHLLPFDGVIDWQEVAGRLNRCGYDGILTFELKTASPPGHHENDAYRQMPLADYLAEACRRARRVAQLIEKAK